MNFSSPAISAKASPPARGDNAAASAAQTPHFREKDAVCIELKATPAPVVSNASKKNGAEVQLSNLLIRVQLLRDRLPQPGPGMQNAAIAYRQLSAAALAPTGGLQV